MKTMDYEKKYKEALERARKLKETCDSTAVIGWCEYFFPELKGSEENERMRNASIRACQYMVEHFENSTWDYEDAIDWLKSLKPQPQWKPSEEQINALDEVYKTHGANGTCRRVIFNLLEQLKTL